MRQLQPFCKKCVWWYLHNKVVFEDVFDSELFLKKIKKFEIKICTQTQPVTKPSLPPFLLLPAIVVFEPPGAGKCLAGSRCVHARLYQSR
jgi:hypothetical protein